MSNTTSTGNHNTGDYNTGHYNTGDYNTGHWNTGNHNTGYYNTGNHNTGDYNTGNWNTGHWNAGYYNTGNHNTGNYNTGYRNTGNRNTGSWNSTNFSSGFFNTQESPIYIFNKIAENVSRVDIDTYLDIYLTEWVLPEDMTEQEKADNPSWETCEGFLRERGFKEACVLAWSKADQETKDRFLNLPNFDADIFFEITGIEVEGKEEKITIEGVEYTLSEIKKALKVKKIIYN
jgi:hypothetical protein